MKRYFKAFGYLLSVHVLALLVMTLFRLVEFIALHGMIVDAEASRVMAFVKGVWFDNVIACYISVLPVAVLLIAASLGWCHRRLLRGINIWYAAWFAIAFMPSAANTPYFQYFFKNINSSIFGWFGYVATTSGMLLQRPRLVQRLIILRMVSRLAPSPRSRLASKRVNCSGSWAKSRVFRDL